MSEQARRKISIHIVKIKPDRIGEQVQIITVELKGRLDMNEKSQMHTFALSLFII